MLRLFFALIWENQTKTTPSPAATWVAGWESVQLSWQKGTLHSYRPSLGEQKRSQTGSNIQGGTDQQQHGWLELHNYVQKVLYKVCCLITSQKLQGWVEFLVWKVLCYAGLLFTWMLGGVPCLEGAVLCWVTVYLNVGWSSLPGRCCVKHYAGSLCTWSKQFLCNEGKAQVQKHIARDTSRLSGAPCLEGTSVKCIVQICFVMAKTKPTSLW